jgi:ParB-like chromosome segregation protein Spo0J
METIAPDWPAVQIEMVAISELIPYIRNPRQHSPQQILQIAASLKEFGWTMPVLRRENNVIIAGHGRIMAAQKLAADATDPERDRWLLAPVTTARGWPESKFRAYVIADNKLATNSSWDPDLLSTEIAALNEEDYDISVLGFSDEDLARLADDLTAEQFGEAAAAPATTAPEIHAAVAHQPGDLVALTIPMAPAQRHTIFEAIEKAKALFTIDQSGEALCRIAQQFLDRQ